MADKNKEMDQEKFVPPNVERSDYFNGVSETPITLFQKLPQEVAEIFKKYDFTTLDKFDDANLEQSYTSIVEAFDTCDQENLFSSPPELIPKFKDYLCEHLDPKVYSSIATVWPPVLPCSDEHFEKLSLMLVRMLRKCRNPCLFLHWLAVEIFPVSFTRVTQVPAFAACRAKYDKNYKNEGWAVLTGESDFILYTFKKSKDGTPKVVAEGKCTKVKVDTDKLTVEVLGEKDAPITMFQPVDPQQVELWSHALDDNRPPFPFYITSFSTPIVDQSYVAMQVACGNSDAIVLKACLSDDICPPHERRAYTLISSFLDIYSYQNRATVFYNTIISHELIYGKIDAKKVAEESHIRHLFEALFEKYGQAYRKKVLIPLLNYINTKLDCNLGQDTMKIDDAEVLFFTTIKYIVDSFHTVPVEVRHALHMLRTMLAARENKIGTYIEIVLSIFFRAYLLNLLANPTVIIPDFKVSNVVSYNTLIKLLHVPFSLGKMNGEFSRYEGFERRLVKHMYPKIFDMCIALADIDDSPNYLPPKPDLLARSLENIMKIISESYDNFKTKYNSYINSESRVLEETNIGSNYISLLTLFFKTTWDKLESIADEDSVRNKKKHRHKLIKAELAPDSNGVIRRIVRRDPNDVEDPNKPRKYYKRVVKHVQKINL